MFGGIFGRTQPRAVAEVSPEVAQALVRADETVRRGTDELGFATAEFGEVAARELATGLAHAQQHLQEAFRLNALLLDDEPETPEQRARMEASITAATAEVERLVGEPAAAFATRRAALRDAPTTIGRLRAEIADVQTRLPEARTAVSALEERYDASAVVAVAENADQAQELLGFAERSLALAERRHDAGRGDEATRAIQVASDSIGRAADLLDGVASYEVEAVPAESTLAAVLADSRSDVAQARRLLASRHDPAIEEATTALEQRIAATDPQGHDPFTALNELRAANAELDRLVAEHRTRPERELLRAHLVAALADAERQIARAHTLVADHGGLVGPQPRTRLAQAERLLDGVTLLDDARAALEQSRRSADLAAEAAALAERDVAAAQQQWRGGHGPGGGIGGVGGVLGGVLGGMVLGGILDDIDLDFD